MRPIWRINGQIVTSSPWFLRKVLEAGKIEEVLRGERGVLLGAQVDAATLGSVPSPTAEGHELRLLQDRGPHGAPRIVFRWVRRSPDRGLMYCRGGLCYLDEVMARRLLPALGGAIEAMFGIGNQNFEGGDQR